MLMFVLSFHFDLRTYKKQFECIFYLFLSLFSYWFEIHLFIHFVLTSNYHSPTNCLGFRFSNANLICVCLSRKRKRIRIWCTKFVYKTFEIRSDLGWTYQKKREEIKITKNKPLNKIDLPTRKKSVFCCFFDTQMVSK